MALKVGKRRETKRKKRWLTEGEQDGRGGCVGPSVVQEKGRKKKKNVMRVLLLSELEREKGT